MDKHRGSNSIIHQTTSIHPSSEKLKELRLKFGIVTSEKHGNHYRDPLIEKINFIDNNDNRNNSIKSNEKKLVPNARQKKLIEVLQEIRLRIDQLSKLEKKITQVPKQQTLSRFRSDYLADNQLQIINSNPFWQSIEDQNLHLKRIEHKLDGLINVINLIKNLQLLQKYDHKSAHDASRQYKRHFQIQKKSDFSMLSKSQHSIDSIRSECNIPIEGIDNDKDQTPIRSETSEIIETTKGYKSFDKNTINRSNGDVFALENLSYPKHSVLFSNDRNLFEIENSILENRNILNQKVVLKKNSLDFSYTKSRNIISRNRVVFSDVQQKSKISLDMNRLYSKRGLGCNEDSIMNNSISYGGLSDSCLFQSKRSIEIYGLNNLDNTIDTKQYLHKYQLLINEKFDSENLHIEKSYVAEHPGSRLNLNNSHSKTKNETNGFISKPSSPFDRHRELRVNEENRLLNLDLIRSLPKLR